MKHTIYCSETLCKTEHVDILYYNKSTVVVTRMIWLANFFSDYHAVGIIIACDYIENTRDEFKNKRNMFIFHIFTIIQNLNPSLDVRKNSKC